jgi:hypothetical protein
VFLSTTKKDDDDRTILTEIDPISRPYVNLQSKNPFTGVVRMSKCSNFHPLKPLDDLVFTEGILQVVEPLIKRDAPIPSVVFLYFSGYRVHIQLSPTGDSRSMPMVPGGSIINSHARCVEGSKGISISPVPVADLKLATILGSCTFQGNVLKGFVGGLGSIFYFQLL